MTDRELLELAAKASEIKILDWSPWPNHGGGWIDDAEQTYWNPLRDSGDALRLAVKLKMDVTAGQSIKVVCATNSYGASRVVLPLGNDHVATTRLAIVMAAAEIGKGMR